MKHAFYLVLTVLVVSFQCCQKTFLDGKPRTELLIPKTLEDLGRLMSNEGMLDQTPGFAELSTDDFYLTANYWQSLNPVERNAYVWAADIYEGTDNWHDWNNAYVQVFYANVVLETLLEIPQTGANLNRWNQLKGRALFLRAYAYHNLSQVFTPMYDDMSRDEPWGLPLKYTTSLDEPLVRSTLGETYERILIDLQEAVPLLSQHYQVSNPSIPTKVSAYAALSRVCLSMGKYREAGVYADSSLALHAGLLEYTQLNTSTNNPFPLKNQEVLYSSKVNANISTLLSINTNVLVDDVLYGVYQAGDIRKQVYFRLLGELPVLKNGYYAGFYRFSGLTTAEMYLNRAEAAARTGDIQGALTDLDALASKRFLAEDFEPFSAASAEEALALVLAERRRELCFRGLRWTDLRRLNKEGAGITLRRELDVTTYTLPPNSNRYTFPIPMNTIINSNITQHERTSN